MTGSASFVTTREARRWRASATVATALVLFAAVALALAPPAHAGQAASGELLLYPCSECHPVTDGSTENLPNGFEGHEVVLEIHDVLGTGSDACMVCHGDPTIDPSIMNAIGGTTVEITGDVSKVCYQCHSGIYHEFLDGIHGRDKDGCTDSGCHDPHTPGYIYAEGLIPFVGNGFQFKVLPETETFTPLASPPEEAPIHTPAWFNVLVLLGMVGAGGQVLMLVRGGQKR